MKNIILIISLLILVFITTFVKNTTKDIDDQIYTYSENLSLLNDKKEFLKLEFDYLSSPKKLSELQILFFDEVYKPYDYQSIGIIYIKDNQILFEDNINFNKD